MSYLWCFARANVFALSSKLLCMCKKQMCLHQNKHGACHCATKQCVCIGTWMFMHSNSQPQFSVCKNNMCYMCSLLLALHWSWRSEILCIGWASHHSVYATRNSFVFACCYHYTGRWVVKSGASGNELAADMGIVLVDLPVQICPQLGIAISCTQSCWVPIRTGLTRSR